MRTCLGMLRLGADGETAAELDQVLRLTQDDRAGEAALLAAVLPDQDAEFVLASANALWAQDGWIFAPGFAERCEQTYGAGLGRVDFRDDAEGARRRINAWTAGQTRDRIQQQIGPGAFHADTRLVATNAVYFKAIWALGWEFKKEETLPAPFHAADGAQMCQLMRQQRYMSHHAADGMQLAVLPYRGGTLEMLLLVPDALDGLAAVESRLTPQVLSQWRAAAEPREVELLLPRFTLRVPLDLGGSLQELGLRRCFGPMAQFSGIAAEPLLLAEVRHQSWIAVDEEGTEAAAATAGVVERTSISRGASPRPLRSALPGGDQAHRHRGAAVRDQGRQSRSRLTTVWPGG